MSIEDLGAAIHPAQTVGQQSPGEYLKHLVPFLDELLSNPPPDDQYLPRLEQIRKPLDQAGGLLQVAFQDRPLPLGQEDEEVLQLLITAYRRILNAYGQVMDRLAQHKLEPWYPYRMAVLLQRLLFYTSRVALIHYFGRRELPAGLWTEIHRAYAMAESLGVENNPVDDELEPHRQASSCSNTYVAAQLVALASPYSLSLRSLPLIQSWASLWSPLIAIHTHAQGSEIPALVINLSLDCGLVVPGTSPTSPYLRFLDTTRMELEIRRTLKKLREKVPPGRLGLGDEAPTVVIRLVGRIARPWGQLVIPRRYRRSPAPGKVVLSTGFEAIHYFVTGSEFSSTDGATLYSRDIYESRMSTWHQVETFSTQQHRQTRAEYLPDVWNMADSSQRGMRILRSIEGRRISHGQLVCIRSQDEDGPISLGYVASLLQENRGGLTAGLSVFPGCPQGVAFSLLPETPEQKREYARALLLPKAVDVEDEASLIIPLGLYYPGRRFEYRADKQQFVGTLRTALDKGSDFERVSFILDGN